MKITIKGIAAFLLFPAIFTISACTGNKSGEKKTGLTANSQVSDNAIMGLNPGNRAPELAFPSPQGDTIALSEFRGKLVLIDFWASWCLPCRVENPNLVNLYNTYKDSEFINGNGFMIYSVSLDKKPELWNEGIDKDGLAWKAHVSDLKGWYSVPAAIFQVTSIPSNFLIDGNGIIIVKNLRAEALETTIKGLLK